MSAYVIGLDQGTTGTRAIVFGLDGAPVSERYLAHKQYHPHPDWTEHDPEELVQNCISVLWGAVADAVQAGVPASDIRALGMANQGESVVAWDRVTGKALYPVIVWQCKRSAARVKEQFSDPARAALFRERTGLVPDAYYSASKWQWLLENVPAVQTAQKDGRLMLGNLDSFLLYRLTGEKTFLTDPSTASRSLVYDIRRMCWDAELLRVFGIPEGVLPPVAMSADDFGHIPAATTGGADLPVFASLVDQPASLLGQGCIRPGDAKCTFGTGCFLLTNTGSAPVVPENGLTASVGWQTDRGTAYIMDGGVYAAGTVLNWLRNTMRFFSDPADADKLAFSVPDTGGAAFLPAFCGLAAPSWQTDIRGTLVGVTADTAPAHIVRAALDGIAYQVNDVLASMEACLGRKLSALSVDGGVSNSAYLMQRTADLGDITVRRCKYPETTALGAAMLAACRAGLLPSLSDMPTGERQEFSPAMTEQERAGLMLARRRLYAAATAWTEQP